MGKLYIVSLPLTASKFFGREEELRGLRLLTKKRVASLVVVTGRRRIGKSRLVEHFAGTTRGYRQVSLTGLPPVTGVNAASQRAEFARQLEEQLGGPPVQREDWGDLFLHLANLTARGRWVILLDEIFLNQAK